MSINIVDETFQKWTTGLDEKQKRINIFEKIRDIPYTLISKPYTPDEWRQNVLENNKGSCHAKHLLLGEMFEKLGLQVRYCTFAFSWDDPLLDYPPDLKKMSRDMPLGYHLALRVLIDGKWRLIDATWDIKLKSAGFPVNENWDGCKDTMLAVTASEEIEHKDADERHEFTMRKKGSLSPEKIEAVIAFYKEFNDWTQKIRLQ